MASPRVVAFLDQLRDSQLLEPAQWNEAQRHPLARGDDPVALAKELLRQSRLTPFQANQLLNGQGKGLVLGPYRVQDRLGEGGMGQVFRAYHPTMDRMVALKVIRREKLANPMAVQRFLQEIRAAAKLVHANIVTAFDAGQVGDTYFFAMEYVDGTDLSRLVREQGPLGVAEACEYVRQAALGLQHAHEAGMVHRDIKPGNLLLARSPVPGSRVGTIKILDMGLARLHGPEDNGNGLTRIGAIVGTPGYLAPEQVRDAHGVDIRADLYSLGCTFFFLLTGRKPFQGDSVNDVLLKQQTEEPPPLATLRADVPPVVQAIITRLLAKRPEERFQTPAELAAALQSLLRQKTGTRATPVSVQQTPLPVALSAAPTVAADRTPIVAVDRSRWRGSALRWLTAAAVGLLFVTGVVLGVMLYPESKSTAKSAQAGTATYPSTPREKSDSRREQTAPRLPESRPLAVPPTEVRIDKTNPTGSWTWTSMFAGQPRPVTLRLKLDGEQLSGTLAFGGGGGSPIEDARYRNGEISFRAARERFGQRVVTKYEGKLVGDTIKGTTETDVNGQMRHRDWEAKRVPD